jgi:hypothetical protein
MSRRAKARRAHSAEPGERGGSVDPPPASVRENNQNRGSEETLDMSSVMATDMQHGGGPKMKRNPVSSRGHEYVGVCKLVITSMFWLFVPKLQCAFKSTKTTAFHCFLVAHE